MFQLIKKFLFLLLLFCLFNSCKEEVGPCDNLEGQIHEDLRNMFPYSLNLSGIVFEDLLGDEVVFDVIYKIEKNTLINPSGEFPYEAQFLEFALFNSQLDIHFNIVVFGSYTVTNCPDMVSLNNFVSIRAPLPYQVAASDSGQSSKIIIVDVVDDNIVLGNESFSSILWAGQVFEKAYQTSGDFESYFNFEIGIIGFKDEATDIDYVYKKTLTE